MPKVSGGPNGKMAFVALDEAQLGANRERGHIFTDHLLHTRGRQETMLLGSATLEPLIKSLIPRAQITERPRFSTLTHIGPFLSAPQPASLHKGPPASPQPTPPHALARRMCGAAAAATPHPRQ